MKAVRFWLGLAALLAGVLIFIYIGSRGQGSAASTSTGDIIGEWSLAFWLFFSVVSRLSMMVGVKSKWPNGLALASWAIFGIYGIAYAFGLSSDTAQSLTAIENILLTVFLFGGPIIDIADACYLQS